MGQIFEILVVDDNPTDIKIMEEALRDSRVVNRLHAVRDGIEAMAFLRHEGEFQEAPRPDLILLDLNMPRKGGIETLTEIKATPALRSIPTVMLTSSQEQITVARAYNLGANGYVVKPVDLDDFTAILGGIEEYWSGVVKLPVTASP